MELLGRKARGTPNRTESSTRSPRLRRDERSPNEEPEEPDIPQKVSRKLDFGSTYGSKLTIPFQPQPGRGRPFSSESGSHKQKTFSSAAADMDVDEEIVPIVRKPLPVVRSSISSVPKRSMATKMPMRIAKSKPESENDEPVMTNYADEGKAKQKRGRPPRAQTKPYPVERGSDSKKRSNVPQKQTSRAGEPAKFNKKVASRAHEGSQNAEVDSGTFHSSDPKNDAGNETYTMEDEEVQAGTSGFDKGKTAEKIVGVTTICRPMVYLVKWKNSNTIEPVPSSTIKEKDPSLVIDFLESCIGPKINSLLQ